MTEGNFVDYIRIFAKSGKGGSGSVHLHRETYIASNIPHLRAQMELEGGLRCKPT